MIFAIQKIFTTFATPNYYYSTLISLYFLPRGTIFYNNKAKRLIMEEEKKPRRPRIGQSRQQMPASEGMNQERADYGNDAPYDGRRYDYDQQMARRGYLTVDKGSVCVNGVSLTVCNPGRDNFQVAIIPYTMQHTNFQDIHVGTVVNIEFDIIGKYIARLKIED